MIDYGHGWRRGMRFVIGIFEEETCDYYCWVFGSRKEGDTRKGKQQMTAYEFVRMYAPR